MVIRLLALIQIVLLFTFHLFTFQANLRADSVVQPQTKWSKKEIRVCWGDVTTPQKYFTKKQKKELFNVWNKLITPKEKLQKVAREIIDQEFREEETGIHFVDWEKCDDEGNWDVSILITFSDDQSTNPGASNLGQGASLEDLSTHEILDLSQRRSYVLLNLPQKLRSLNYEFQSVVLHEFGHVAGLRHEHPREEHKSDPLCRDMKAMISLGEKGFQYSSFYGEYDPTSIMNYCWIFFLRKFGLNVTLDEEDSNGSKIHPDLIKHLVDERIVTRNEDVINFRIGLSSGDLHALKCLYVYEGQEYEESCKKGHPVR